jgi:hypothetical protein
MCLSVIVKSRYWGPGSLGAVAPWKKSGTMRLVVYVDRMRQMRNSYKHLTWDRILLRRAKRVCEGNIKVTIGETVCQSILDWTPLRQVSGAGNGLSTEFLDLMSATIRIQEGQLKMDAVHSAEMLISTYQIIRRQNPQAHHTFMLLSCFVTGIMRRVGFCTLHHLWPRWANKSRMRYVEYVQTSGKIRRTYRILVGKPERKRSLG